MSRLVAALSDPPDLEAVLALPNLGEVLLEHRELSRRGLLDDDAVLSARDHLTREGMRPVLVWDVLADDKAIANGLVALDRLGGNGFGAIRVQDVGVAALVRERFPQMPLQLIVETGNHNLIGLRTWQDVLAPERLIVSNEIPIRELGEMRQKLSVPLEIQVLGRMLIYCTPRPLLPGDDTEDVLSRLAISEEDGKRFPIVQNRHGCFMYYEKNLFLLPWLEEIAANGIDWVRLDFSFFPAAVIRQAATYLEAPTGAHRNTLEESLGPRLTRGFFKSNRTDKQFTRLKNPCLGQREDLIPLGFVVGTRKKSYTAILAEKPLVTGDRICFAIPEGELIQAEVTSLRKPTDEETVSRAEPGLWLIDHCKKVSAGSRVYFADLSER